MTLGLTPLGRKLDGEVIGVTERAVTQLLEVASPAEVSRFRSVLAALTAELSVQIEASRASEPR